MRILIFILLFSFSNQLFGQEKKKDYVTLQIQENKLISGQLIKLDKDSIFINNDNQGLLSFGRNDVQQMVKGVVSNVDRTNLSEPFYFPTAISNGKGNHHYKNYYLFGHNFNFGLTDALDLSLGFELFSLGFSNDSYPVFQIGAKYSRPINDKFHVGIAGKWLFNNEGGLSFFQVPFTVGGKDHNLTLSPSVGLNSEFEDRTFFLGGVWSFAITRKIRLITDFMFADEFRTSNIALEFLVKNKFTLIPGALWSNEFSLIPTFAMTVPFGQWK